MAVKVRVVGEVDMKQLERAKKQIASLERETAKKAGGIKGSFLKMQDGAKGFLGDIRANGPAAVATLAAVGYASWKAIDAASGLAESESKVGVVFGKSAESVKRWAQDTETSMGMSERAALEAAGTYGNLFRAIGLSENASADMSTTLVRLAGDLASFNNANPEDVLLALRSGLSGETEPLKRFGVALNDTRLKEEALRLGLIETTKGTLPQAIKTQAAYSLILKDTSLAQTDFARTSEGVANQQRIMAASWEELTASAGKFLIEQGKAPEVMGRWSLFFQKLSEGDYAGAFFDDLNKEWKESAGSAEEAQKAYDDARKGLGDLKNQQGEAKGSIEALTGATDAQSEATKKLTRDMQGHMVAMDDLSGRQRTLTEKQIEASDAAIAVREAQKSYNDAVKKSGKNSDEAKSALNNLRRAKLRAADASVDLTAAEREYAEATEAAKEKARQFAANLERIRKSANEAGDALDRMYGKGSGNAARKAGTYGGRSDRAVGAIEQARPGGTWVRVAEAGYDEALIPINNRSRSYDLLFETMRRMGVSGSGSSGVVIDLRGAQFGSGLTKAQVQGWMVDVLKQSVRTSGQIQVRG